MKRTASAKVSTGKKIKKSKKKELETPHIPLKNFDNFFENYDLNVSDFFCKNWQKSICIKKPKAIRDNIFNTEILLKIIEKYPILHELDFCASKYDSETQTRVHFDPEDAENTPSLIKKETVEDLIKQGNTIQFHQPQRFSKSIHQLIELFESQFKSLAGCNVYLTPEKTQGLAPHYDNIDAFVIQLEGSKKWTFWTPKSDDEKLPIGSESVDIPENDLTEDLYEKQEVLLEKGDFCYFPRGVIHCAKATDSTSVHITISVYESMSKGEVLKDAFDFCMDKILDSDIDSRRGVGVDVTDWKNELGFERVAEILKTANLDGFIPKHVIDFYKNRIPPVDTDKQPVGPQPGASSWIQFIHPCHILISDELITETECDEIENEEEDYVFIFSSSKNAVQTHMMGGQDSAANYLDLLEGLLEHPEANSSQKQQIFKLIENLSPNPPLKMKKSLKPAIEYILKCSSKEVSTNFTDMNSQNLIKTEDRVKDGKARLKKAGYHAPFIASEDLMAFEAGGEKNQKTSLKAWTQLLKAWGVSAKNNVLKEYLSSKAHTWSPQRQQGTIYNYQEVADELKKLRREDLLRSE